VKHVHILVRSDGLAASMSRYLIRRIEEHPRITLHTRSELVSLEGQGHLERTVWRCSASGEVETWPIRHVFLMTGAEPNTGWLAGCIALDAKGFVKTGADLGADDLAAAEWPLARPPHLLETSVPGIFAVGDVRAGNVKRVASAVGEGSISVQLVHKALAGG
jgi:thioredoxin reductase (NADPH)